MIFQIVTVVLLYTRKMPTWFINGAPFTQFFNTDGSPIVDDAGNFIFYRNSGKYTHTYFQYTSMNFMTFVCVTAMVL